MSYTHTWSISGVYGHPLNSNCIYKVSANLTSVSGETSVTTEHTFYLPPNVLPETSDEEQPSNEIVWVDSLPDFVSTSNLTEEMLWQWLDANESRAALEAENEQQMPADVAINLPFVSA